MPAATVMPGPSPIQFRAMKSFLAFLLLFLTLQSSAQNLTVPENILSELTTVTALLPGTTDSVQFRVAYPANYQATEQYRILLGLSGGNQSEKIVNYCYAAWFRSQHFSNYLTIMPVAPEGSNLRDFSTPHTNCSIVS